MQVFGHCRWSLWNAAGKCCECNYGCRSRRGSVLTLTSGDIGVYPLAHISHFIKIQVQGLCSISCITLSMTLAVRLVGSCDVIQILHHGE